MIRTRILLLIVAFSALVTTGAAVTASVDPEIVAVAPNPAAPTTSPQSIAVSGRNFLEHLTLSVSRRSPTSARRRSRRW
jgi:hypothetical protein